MALRSFIEVQFPIGPLSLESYIERLPYVGKPLNSLGKWWGVKPLVLARAIILGSVFPASDDPERWPNDLDIFLKCMCFDNAGMWKRKTKPLPASICYPYASPEECEELFEGNDKWRRGAPRGLKQALEKRVFYTLGHTEQREYCCRVEEIDGPPEESREEINSYLGTSAYTLSDLVQELAQRTYGTRLKVGDPFCGIGAIPFEAAELGCDVYASELNPVACLLTWGALNIIGGTDEFRQRVHDEQERIYHEVDSWILENGLETSEEGWRAEAYLYCVEIEVPQWDGWRIPICPSWIIAPKLKTWVELVPIETEKRFGFRVRTGGDGFAIADQGTKQEQDIICPPPLWGIFKRDGRHKNIPRTIPYSTLIESRGGLRRWENRDFMPRPDDLLQERLYCIRWRKPDWVNDRGRECKGDIVYRAPRSHDLDAEEKVVRMLKDVFDDWQARGWIPSWRIEPGYNTNQPIREKGWTYWHHLFTPRQLLTAGYYSWCMSNRKRHFRTALILPFGRIIEANARLTRWKPKDGGGVGGTVSVYYNQALNTLSNYAARGWVALKFQAQPNYQEVETSPNKWIQVLDARKIQTESHVWITDPPYADAVNYDELSEFFLAWYVPHIKAVFPDWYTHSMRAQTIKGSDAPFRVAMAGCYRQLTDHMPDNGMQILMFTHKSTDVWEDLALIMWAAGLQVKQVWSIATETPGAGIRQGSYVQATYNMVLKKRIDNKMGFIDFITPQVNKRVKEVITHMRESQIEGGLARCGYTDTDYLLAAQAAAAEVVTGYASIDGIDLKAELRTPNAERGRSALRNLMENAKRAATDFLVPPVLDRALKNTSGAINSYQFWREFSPEEKFILKGLELEQQGVFKIGAFQDLGRAYGLSNYEELLGPTRANNTRTKIPEEFPRPDGLRFQEVPASDRNLWHHSPTRHIYHSLRLLHGGADIDRAVKHLVDSTDFWNIRTSRLAVILAYLMEMTNYLSHWVPYSDHLTALLIGVENWKA